MCSKFVKMLSFQTAWIRMRRQVTRHLIWIQAVCIYGTWVLTGRLRANNSQTGIKRFLQKIIEERMGGFFVKSDSVNCLTACSESRRLLMAFSNSFDPGDVSHIWGLIWYRTYLTLRLYILAEIWMATVRFLHFLTENKKEENKQLNSLQWIDIKVIIRSCVCVHVHCSNSHGSNKRSYW